MNVLFLTREYPPFQVGGVAIHTFHLVRNLTNLGITCKVLSFGDPSRSDDIVSFIEPSSSIIRRSDCPIVMDVKIPFDIIRFTNAANNLIKNNGFDIVHVEEPYVGAFARHRRKVTTVHDTSYAEIKSIFHGSLNSADLKRTLFYSSLGFCSEQMSIASSRTLIVPCWQVRDELVKFYGAPKEKINIVRNGVALPDLPTMANKVESKKKLGYPTEKMLIFTVGRFIARKRLDTLVKAIGLLKEKKVEGYDVVIAGDGPLKAFIARLVKQHNLERVVELPGWILEEQLSLYYQAADIFVLTSEYETGPISLLEAMSFGIPVISSKISGFPEVMNGNKDGLLFSVGDYYDLSKRIENLLNNASLRTRLSHSARLFAEKFDWETVAGDTLKLYEKLL